MKEHEKGERAREKENMLLGKKDSARVKVRVTEKDLHPKKETH